MAEVGAGWLKRRAQAADGIAMAPFSWLNRAARVAFGRRFPFVLCYHGVGTVEAADPASLFISRGLFAHHLDVISAQGYDVLPVGDLWRALDGGSPGHNVAAISFDDALVKTAREAIPETLARGMGATVFVPTGLMGRPHPDLPDERILSAPEIVELAKEGVEIGAHGVEHDWLEGMPYDEVLDQMRRSKAALEDLLGRAVTSMSYPYGAHDEQTERAAREAGFLVACGCSGPGPWSPHALPRNPVFASATTLRLRLKMAGLYGPVHRLVADSGPIGRWRARPHHLPHPYEPRVLPRQTQRTTA
jgi:peptidoglycan/xylan/chitin deacetylase (PgdA/CDA1 family)